MCIKACALFKLRRKATLNTIAHIYKQLFKKHLSYLSCTQPTYMKTIIRERHETCSFKKTLHPNSPGLTVMKTSTTKTHLINTITAITKMSSHYWMHTSRNKDRINKYHDKLSHLNGKKVEKVLHRPRYIALFAF